VLNERFSLKNSGCSNGVHGAALPRHRWYRVKESFSPALVEAAIGELQDPENARVVDPFSGSGTTVVTCALRGQAAVGMELNPFLAFVSRAKLARASRKALLAGAKEIRTTVQRGRKSRLEGVSTFTERPGLKKWLFNTPISRSFEGGWRASAALRPNIRRLVRLALFGAAMDTCNATRDGKCLRYRADWIDRDFGRRDFLAALDARVESMGEDLTRAPRGLTRAPIRVGDSRKLTRSLEKNAFELCVTSPPYLNSFDYSDIYRPELFLGGYVESNAELMSLRMRTIRSHVQAKWKRPQRSDFGPLFRECASRVEERKEHLWDTRIPLMIRAYFEDLDGLLRSLYAAASPGAVVWLVVSTSAYAGVEIPVDLILAEIGTRTGWRLREVGVLRYMRTSGQHWARWAGEPGMRPQLRESAVILEKFVPHSRRRRR
tara:strand:- start:2298 stop:3596 length:1299 start_codon:yes stop_codon:yes gene_type:complete